jgi:hypothetical protein
MPRGLRHRTLVFWALVSSIAIGAVLNAASWRVIADGLDNPRGIGIGPDGGVYVAEAGSGGASPCAPGPEGIRCYGLSGAISRIDLRTLRVERVTSGLPSLATEGDFAAGPQDISFQGRGNAYLTLGFGGDPGVREAQFGPAGAAFAQLARTTPDGGWRLISDLGAFEEDKNPTGDEVDSNPYGVLAQPGRQLVVDAGANALVEVRTNGDRTALATFPNRLVLAPPFLGLPPGAQIPMDAVPTSVVVGPDGAYYVSQLTGFPFPVGGANVYRVPAGGGTPQVYASGYTAIIDILFGPDGSLYVVEIAANGLLEAFGANDWTGALIRVMPDGTRTEIAAGALTAPGGVAMGPDGALYVTNRSIFSNAGQVLEIRQ